MTSITRSSRSILARSARTRAKRLNINPDANSFGWFYDTSANLATNYEQISAEEYAQTSATSFVATSGDPAGGIDLLSLLLHEQGHALGLANSTSPSDVMYGPITEGMRWLPSAGEASGATPSGTLYTDFDPAPAADTSNSLAGRGANYNRVVADMNSGSGVIDYVNVNADASPDLNIVLGAGSVVSAGIGNVSLNVESDNIATANGSALPGIPPPIAVVTADATVGGTINVSLAGTIMHQGDLTLELNTVNEAEASGDAMSVGPFGGTGVSTDAVVTPTINTFVAPSSNINVSGNFAILTLSQSSATAISNGIADSASLSVGVSLANAEVAPTINTYIGAGATITAGGSITVETLQNEDQSGNPIDNAATATAQASAGALIGSGTGAQATADNSPKVSAYVDQGATLSAGPNSPIVIQALANNVANADAGGVAFGGLLAVGASLATATTNGSTNAYLDGNVTQGGSLTVSAASVHDATATTTALAGGIASGTYNDSNASVNPSNTASIYDGNQVNVTDGVSVLSTSNDTANALTDGTQDGAVAIGISTSEATVSDTTSASVGNNVVIDAGSGDVNVQAQSTQTAQSDGTASTGGIVAVGSTTATSLTTSDAAATIGDDTSITTNGNIAITSTSMTTGSDATTSNGTGGFFADSAPASANTINTTSVATLGASDNLTSNLGNVTVLAVSDDTNDNATASASGGGFVSLASPSASLTVTDPATATVGPGSAIHAVSGTIVIQSQIGLGAASSASTSGIAVGIDASATASTSATSAATTNVNSGAGLSANDVQLLAGALPTGRAASASTSTIAEDLGDTITSTSNTTTNYSASVNVYAGSGSGPDPDTSITGTTGVTIDSDNGPATASSISDAESNSPLPVVLPAFVGDTTSNANNTSTATSSVFVDSTALTDIATANLTVLANLPAPSLTTSAKRSAALLDTGSANPNPTTPVQSSSITFNADVTILGEALELHIGPNGQVIQPSSGIAYQISNSQIKVGALTNPSSGQATLTTTGATQQLSGSPIFHYSPSVSLVSIINDDPAYSLVIPSISAVVAHPMANLTVSSSSSTGWHPTTNFVGPAPTSITITNTVDTQVILTGDIQNALGSTTIFSRGNISSSGASQSIETGQLSLSSTGGSIGSNSARVIAQLVQADYGSPAVLSSPSVQATAPNGNVYLDLAALDQTTDSPPVVVTGSALSGQLVNLRLEDGNSQTAGQTGTTPEASTYNLGGVAAAQSLVIQAGTTGTVNLSLEGAGSLNIGTVTTNAGVISLTAGPGGSIEGGAITTGLGNVTLTAGGSITGVSITTGQGKVTLTAGGSIASGAITTKSGDACLTASGGSIVERDGRHADECDGQECHALGAKGRHWHRRRPIPD